MWNITSDAEMISKFPLEMKIIRYKISRCEISGEIKQTIDHFSYNNFK